MASEYLDLVVNKASQYATIINSNTPDFIQVGLPSIDRPFGIYLWPIFNEFANLITRGKFNPDQFKYVFNETFMSTWYEVIGAVIAYYFIINVGQLIFKKLSPLKLNFLFQTHNLYLTIISLTLDLLLFEQVFPHVWQNGILEGVCSPNAWHQKVVVIYYLNYLTKYLEFIDTLFLVVKKKKIIFLHSYHHGATALLCFIQLNGETSVSWVPILLNLSVHVIMYWYYFLAARGIKVWWKRYVTIGQIVQFVLDLIFVYFTTYTFYAEKYSRELGINLPNFGTCYGTPFAAASGVIILSSYLVLFVLLYIKIYSKKSSTNTKKK
ncbi:hypothetical protein WICMUC_004313 [Wickerhamomyces mucosus]|uniref:Elongation of fatty acids protein n=1 Tax=Wickerhamomyces mucosus TaxID=1378264 RepID=A0A9P8PHZ1_9ASCO|nr:hypothetical protein WICMUC_004313 [Wickerhamomyces mucosus]